MGRLVSLLNRWSAKNIPRTSRWQRIRANEALHGEAPILASRPSKALRRGCRPRALPPSSGLLREDQFVTSEQRRFGPSRAGRNGIESTATRLSAEACTRLEQSGSEWRSREVP